MYLVDTNIFIEGLLGQEKAKDVQAFLQNISLDNIMTDLSFHSIGIILFRLQKVDLFLSFINDMIVDGLEILSLSHEDMTDLSRISQQYNLDFDDSYQYIVAEKHGLQLISFDKDFDTLPAKKKNHPRYCSEYFEGLTLHCQLLTAVISTAKRQPFST